jgi:hypothetical protein
VHLTKSANATVFTWADLHTQKMKEIRLLARIALVS